MYNHVSFQVMGYITVYMWCGHSNNYSNHFIINKKKKKRKSRVSVIVVYVKLRMKRLSAAWLGGWRSPLGLKSPASLTDEAAWAARIFGAKAVKGDLLSAWSIVSPEVRFKTRSINKGRKERLCWRGRWRVLARGTAALLFRRWSCFK